MNATVHIGNVLDILPTLESESVNCVVTSPPYWGLRDYGADGQLGLEPTPDEYVAKMVAVFREVRRVLREDGTLWLNLGDSYGPHKQLAGIPWRVAIALQGNGWILRTDVIWSKPACMPDAATDRPTRSHEYLFLFSLMERYHYDAEAIAERGLGGGVFNPSTKNNGNKNRNDQGRADRAVCVTRNKRTVWTIATQPYPEAHFATYPEKLIEPCILAGCPEGGTVLDPFTGSGTTGAVACRLGRNFVGVELNPDYAAMAERRIAPHRDQLQLVEWRRGG